MSEKDWACLGDPVKPNNVVYKVENYTTPRIFKTDGKWVAVNSILYTEYSKAFVPIAEAQTMDELIRKLRPSLFTRIKKFIGIEPC